jgi:hypothetical protein
MPSGLGTVVFAGFQRSKSRIGRVKIVVIKVNGSFLCKYSEPSDIPRNSLRKQ